eukprot:scaffold2276_cov82-Cylindrotheca_fusiformis.AAC.1
MPLKAEGQTALKKEPFSRSPVLVDRAKHFIQFYSSFNLAHNFYLPLIIYNFVHTTQLTQNVMQSSSAASHTIQLTMPFTNCALAQMITTFTLLRQPSFFMRFRRGQLHGFPNMWCI